MSPEGAADTPQRGNTQTPGDKKGVCRGRGFWRWAPDSANSVRPEAGVFAVVPCFDSRPRLLAVHFSFREPVTAAHGSRTSHLRVQRAPRPRRYCAYTYARGPLPKSICDRCALHAPSSLSTLPQSLQKRSNGHIILSERSAPTMAATSLESAGSGAGPSDLLALTITVAGAMVKLQWPVSVEKEAARNKNSLLMSPGAFAVTRLHDVACINIARLVVPAGTSLWGIVFGEHVDMVKSLQLVPLCATLSEILAAAADQQKVELEVLEALRWLLLVDGAAPAVNCGAVGVIVNDCEPLVCGPVRLGRTT
ncbi:hypothetical protein BDK51DRAFT_37927 [Blyttiomyces helicus]|uniref:Uncharacterized protein n=1 Tax=Blyttiomyces helicus TaxID=388810 RepID=A0A4P9WBS2_9FUNG|nr:hypothetical protein BDK51DRAFT_37927 [Blyttiomyces helicus]|eukprot:RKO90071.1 hypothetical protein BDK51DRAFT_37927 [Blyttiomyces helicus]